MKNPKPKLTSKAKVKKKIYTVVKMQTSIRFWNTRMDVDKDKGVVGFLFCFTNKKKAEKFADGAGVYVL